MANSKINYNKDFFLECITPLIKGVFILHKIDKLYGFGVEECAIESSHHLMATLAFSSSLDSALEDILDQIVETMLTQDMDCYYKAYDKGHAYELVTDLTNAIQPTLKRMGFPY